MAEAASFDRWHFGMHGAEAFEQMRQRRINASIDRQIDAAAGRIPILEIRPWPPHGYGHMTRLRKASDFR